MNSSEVLVIFRPPATLLAVADVAFANNWKLAEHFQRGEQQNEELIYELPDGETVVRGIDDYFVAVVFAAIAGPQSHEVEKLLRDPELSIDEATLWLWAERGSAEERSFAMRAFAAVSTETADRRVLDLYRGALRDDRPLVRTALLEAVGRVAWTELWPLVEDIAKSNTVEALRLKEGYELHVPRVR